MRTIETTAVVQPDHTLTVNVPEDIPAGPCRVVLVIEPPADRTARTPIPIGRVLDLPVRDVGPWPEGFTASREQIYDGDGR